MMLLSMSRPDRIGGLVGIASAPDCQAKYQCYGRGLTVKYNKSKKSCYAYVLNDDGELKFIRIPDIDEARAIEVLHSVNVEVEPNGSYELGAIIIQDKFYLYFNKELLKIIEHGDLQGEYNGVISFGKGTHYVDDVSIYKYTYVK